MIQTKHFGSNKIKKRHKKTEVCWCFKSARCNVILFLLLLWCLSWARTQNFHFYYRWICRKMYFWNIICCVQPPGITSALWNISLGCLSMLIIVFFLLTYPHDRQQDGLDEGEWREDADEHAQYMHIMQWRGTHWGKKQKKMGHCLSAASLTACSLKN